MIIGITGGTGCGKTTALKAVKALGGVVLDCDEIYHRLLKTDTRLLKAIEKRFPGTVADGTLQRKALGEIVFSDSQALKDLNCITHSAVKQEVLRLLTPAPKLAAIDAIALHEGGLSELCKLTVAITAPTEKRIARLMARDGISESYAHKRLDAQKTNEQFSALCDYTLVNDTTEEDFYRQCLGFFQKWAIIKEN